MANSRADLAASNDKKARALGATGKYAEAAVFNTLALSDYRKLAETDPEAFTPYLVASLNNLANTLSKLGRHEEALTAAQEASAFYRDLARVRPEAFTPDTATSLNNLAGLLESQGDYAGARPLYERSLAIMEKALGAEHP
ncbi:MAG: tetratricopeptide repeat protein, partial [Methylocystis sp.]